VGLVECSNNSHFDLFPCICAGALGKHSVGVIGGLFTYLEVVLFRSQVCLSLTIRKCVVFPSIWCLISALCEMNNGDAFYLVYLQQVLREHLICIGQSIEIEIKWMYYMNEGLPSTLLNPNEQCAINSFEVANITCCMQ